MKTTKYEVKIEEYENGIKKWYKDDKLHRDNDLPAIVCADGAKYYYKNGKLHRDNDLPAIVWNDGIKKWYKDGKLHRDGDLPSVIYTNGDKLWYKNGIEYKPSKELTVAEIEELLGYNVKIVKRKDE